MPRITLPCLLLLTTLATASADVPRALPDGRRPDDARLREPRTLNGYFPFQQVEDAADWPARREEIRRRILVSQGLWPMPTKAPLNAVVHGRVERDDYVVDRVFFESIPGHYVTGSLYRPLKADGPLPAIVSPHGHWRDGRFHATQPDELRKQLAVGAERFEQGGRHPLQARAVQLARMGCLVFLYDMTGYADSVQLPHRPAHWEQLNRSEDWGFASVQAELRLQNMMGLQTWNAIRALDFVLSLDGVDPSRMGVTGASGGGTQSMILAAVDDRITAAMPCVMVSTAMQGGCTCENAPLLRIDQGNIDIAAATAPRPLGLTAADDWTRELETKGYPDLKKLYEMLGHPDRLTAAFHTEFPHNYNHVNRSVMYGFFNRHFGLGFEEPVLERDYQPLTREEATVWTDEHPAPTGDQVGIPHEVRILQLATEDARQQMAALIPHTKEDVARYREVIGGAWETILGRRLDEVGPVELHESHSEERDGYLLWTGLLEHADAGEVLPALFLHPAANWNRQVVLWITDNGKADILSDGAPIAPVRKLLDAGYSIAAVDLFAQGEFNPSGQPPAEQQMWVQSDGKSAWSPFAGYTFGYNHPLFVRRVHDVLTMLAFARRHELQPEQIHLVGIGEVAGPIVAAARSQAGDAVAKSFVDVGDFQFGNITSLDDPMFVPGAVKYLDVDGLLSLSAGEDVVVATEERLPAFEAVRAAIHAPATGGAAPQANVQNQQQLLERIITRLTAE